MLIVWWAACVCLSNAHFIIQLRWASQSNNFLWLDFCVQLIYCVTNNGSHETELINQMERNCVQNAHIDFMTVCWRFDSTSAMYTNSLFTQCYYKNAHELLPLVTYLRNGVPRKGSASITCLFDVGTATMLVSCVCIFNSIDARIYIVIL